MWHKGSRELGKIRRDVYGEIHDERVVPALTVFMDCVCV